MNHRRNSRPLLFVAAAAMVGATFMAPAQAASKVTLTVWSFGNVFEPKIVDAYRKAHPNITIKITKMNLDDEHNKLLYALPSRAVPDVAAVEMAYMGQFRQPMIATQFTNLNTLGADKIAGEYLPFRWAQGTGLNRAQIGLPTDVGGLAVAYRVDLFKKAGLPTDRTKVAALWPTWDRFISLGKQFQQKMPGTTFMDSTGTLFAAVLNQGNQKYYDEKTRQTIYRTNPLISEAFNIAAKAGCTFKKNGKCAGSIGTKINQFSPDWGAAMNKGAFATVLAPAWMLDYIKQQAPKTSGKWDVAAVPGGGGGNMGGSMLTIPKKAANVKAAWDFISWYLAPAQQLTTFKEYGLFPTTYKVYSKPVIQNYKDKFFSNAPTGKIYSSSALKLKPIFAGAKDRLIDSTFGQALSRITQGSQTKSCDNFKPQTIEAAWCQALADIRHNIGQ